MKAKLIKAVEINEAYTMNQIGRTFEFRNNNIDDEYPIATKTSTGHYWSMSHEFFREHFEPVFSASASDIAFNLHDELNAETVAVILNGIINENGGFAFYNADDIRREFKSRL